MKKMNENPIVGFPKEWASFFERHPQYPQALNNLQMAFDKIFIRQADLRNHADKVVFFMGRLCAEDFNEIFLLAANGYGFGALKLVRGIYENTVTSAYLAKNQDQAEDFLLYHHIHRGKLFKHAQLFFGDLEKFLEAKEINEANEEFEKHKAKFQRVSCKTCKTTTLMHSWSKLDLVSMAKKTDLDHLYFPGFFHPTLQAHATAAAVINRLKSTDDGDITFDGGSQPDIADKALVIAHNLIIRVLDLQNDYFSLKFENELEAINKDFQAVWGDKDK